MTSSTASTFAQLLVAVPVLAAVVSLILARSAPGASRAVSAVTAVLGFLVSVGLLVSVPAEGFAAATTVGPLQVGELKVPLELLVDRPFAVVALAVAFVVACIQLYSVWYMATDPRGAVFQAIVSMFGAAMLLVVLSGDLLLTLIGWEVMGWGSYLLIGHHTFRRSARRAAMKAFLLTRFADIGFVLGIVALAAQTGTTRLAVIFEHFGEGAAAPTAALVLMLIGIAGKSGLIPFHDWLPDAMEGPTPASALIHGATMVAAGTVVVGRLFPLYAESTDARLVLAVLAAATTVYTAVMAFTQNDVKKLLAYSTMSQVALMLGALAAAPAEEHGAAGLDHLVSHAVFKALLFLGAGWLAAIGGGTAFALLRGRMKGWGVLPVSFGLGLAALAGIPPTIGFVSKDGVVAAAREGTTTGAHIVLYATYLTVFLTAMYATRAYLVLVSGDPEEPDHHDDSHTPPPTGSSYTLVAGVIGTLGLLSLVGGAAFLVQGAHIDPTVAAVSVGIALLGVLVSWALSRRPGGDPATVLSESWARATQVNLGTDRVYAGFAAGVVALARVVVRLDNAVVDALPRGLASGATATGGAADRAHRGVPSTGLLAVLSGGLIVLVLGVALWR
ncbi:MAG: proton-conducting transporter membrane subunit [Candidatus Lutibacillus vidarii]